MIQILSYDSLRQKYEGVCARIAAAARLCGRLPEDILLIAVTKTHPVETITAALALGMKNFGENRVQEAEPKINTLVGSGAMWHLIGHLQTNKARRAVRLFDFIHSLDSTSLALRVNRLCAEERPDKLAVTIQVDLAGEQSKTGVSENQLPEMVDALSECDRLSLKGLMTLPPYFQDPERVRPFFRRLRELRDALKLQGRFDSSAGELSMGMSQDFEVAIEEGSTMVRIGTAIFGERETTG